MAPSSIFDVNQYLKYENDRQQPIFDRAFAVRYTVGFVFLINIMQPEIFLGVEKMASFRSFKTILIFLMEIIVR